ncbi:MAG: cupin domain-containing protein [Candidatus Tectomicrobia bacterium]|uniref:Cupin domain-containing protein n=1 Tax=Tectimicrobiota bacterium TaxID=2528274 RepID=A0A932M1R9_UNCTE|nr:cupin domain-containing protein [Candidatus Tectomicrobia bacterium]
MTGKIRRVVTGHDPAGKAVVTRDGAATNVRVRKAAGGLVSTLIWATDETPADISGSADRAARESGVAPPARGSVFRIVDFPPTDESLLQDHEAVTREMGLGHGGAPARHPLMHRTRSVDYAIVMSGEIDMLLDDSEVHLQAGDVVVQQGTNHAWVNRGKENCRIAFVLIDASEPADTGKSEKQGD